MRRLRNFQPDRCYHIISRMANRAFLLNDEERTRFVERLWRVARFSGVEILILSQLRDVPKRPGELREALGISSANYFTSRYLAPMCASGLIAPDKMANRFSPFKRYGLTKKGRSSL